MKAKVEFASSGFNLAKGFNESYLSWPLVLDPLILKENLYFFQNNNFSRGNSILKGNTTII